MQRKIDAGEVLNLLQGRIMTPLFFEDSPRTFSSFCAAMIRLGGSVVNFKVEASSINKGETLADTIRTLDAYSDVLVMRHPRKDAIEEVLSVAQHPILNAGNGAGEHPTQALLDTLTIHSELGSVDGITIALIGDLKMGRTVHSLLKLLVRNFFY
ncbi:putative aspartate carbamoyltransferase [Trypanosoma cruzi]|nr:putative aspartate carbamoyltransferase [Trypanosoma cruzi]